MHLPSPVEPLLHQWRFTKERLLLTAPPCKHTHTQKHTQQLKISYADNIDASWWFPVTVTLLMCEQHCFEEPICIQGCTLCKCVCVCVKCVCVCILWNCTFLQVKCFPGVFLYDRFSVSTCFGSFASTHTSHHCWCVKRCLMCFFPGFQTATYSHSLCCVVKTRGLTLVRGSRCMTVNIIFSSNVVATWHHSTDLLKSVHYINAQWLTKKYYVHCIHSPKWIWITDHVGKAHLNKIKNSKFMWCEANGLKDAKTMKLSFKCKDMKDVRATAVIWKYSVSSQIIV